MTDKTIIKQLAERYEEMCRSPFADGYTFRAFEGVCTEQGFTIDDVRNYIEKEKQDLEVKPTESIKSLKEQLERKEQELENICKAFDIEYAIDEETGSLIGRCNKLYKKEQECEELKKQVDITQMLLDACNNSCEHYKQTLTEIKEIAEDLAPMTDEYDNCYYKDRCSKCKVKEDCQYFKVEQILQKISECEVENEI